MSHAKSVEASVLSHVGVPTCKTHSVLTEYPPTKRLLDVHWSSKPNVWDPQVFQPNIAFIYLLPVVGLEHLQQERFGRFERMTTPNYTTVVSVGTGPYKLGGSDSGHGRRHGGCRTKLSRTIQTWSQHESTRKITSQRNDYSTDASSNQHYPIVLQPYEDG